jgi:tRNA (mo5U34)-methyltransferase
MGTDSMAPVRESIESRFGTAKLEVEGGVDPSTLVRFSPDLPERLSAEEKARLRGRADELDPWLQGPFLLGDDVVVGGVWRNDLRWLNLEAEVAQDLRGVRVLDVGSNAGYDPFMFSLRRPDYVLACEPFAFIEQARFLESIYRTGVDLQEIGWQQLDPERHGRFELVHCHGVLYHELDPLQLLVRLYEMTAPGGTLLFGSMMLADPSLADLIRFVPHAYYGDKTWWWVPGPLAVTAMLESAGFEVLASFGQAGGPPGEFATMNGYFRAVRPA